MENLELKIAKFVTLLGLFNEKELEMLNPFFPQKKWLVTITN